MGADDERRLESLSRQSLTDDQWMKRVSEFRKPRTTTEGAKIVAAILFVAERETVTHALKR
jgi:hypothetical protein